MGAFSKKKRQTHLLGDVRANVSPRGCAGLLEKTEQQPRTTNKSWNSYHLA